MVIFIASRLARAVSDPIVSIIDYPTGTPAGRKRSKLATGMMKQSLSSAARVIGVAGSGLVCSASCETLYCPVASFPCPRLKLTYVHNTQRHNRAGRLPKSVTVSGQCKNFYYSTGTIFLLKLLVSVSFLFIYLHTFLMSVSKSTR